MKALLVGHGRHGQRYSKLLQKMFGSDLQLTVVDPKSPCPFAHHSFSDLSEVPRSINFELAIDARPNLNRIDVFKDFCERRVRHVVIEKPHASSIRESRAMVDLLSQYPNTKVMLPYYLRNAPNYDRNLISGLGAGNLTGITVQSGAIGIGCNGVHYIDLANHFFGSPPLTVYGDIVEDTIPSPRGDHFKDHAGTIVVQYASGAFVFQSSHRSSNGVSHLFQFEKGKIEMRDQMDPSWAWYKRGSDFWDLPVYRTNLESEVAPPIGFSFDIMAMIESGLRSFLSGSRCPSLIDGHATLKVIGLALVSSREGRRMNWDDDSSIEHLTFSFT